jgi:hypothetical protein
MTTIIISSQQMQFPFGAQTNQLIGRLIWSNTSVARLSEAIATASAGFNGTAGTQFETGNIDPANNVPNLFGIQADPAAPGAQGTAYRYAMEQLAAAWQSFWTAAAPYVEQLDNGQMTM